MLRRLILFIVILLTLFVASSVTVLAAIEERNNVIESIVPYVDENIKINRGDCIATIMKLIGVDKESASMYANSVYDQPVFYDIEYDDVNLGYIILAKFSGVAYGVKICEYDDIHNFEPNRDVTVKECLTFMLRCLKNSETVEWKSIISQAIGIGLLQDEETQNINLDEALTSGMFKALLERALNMERHLYWPEEDAPKGYAKSMKIDEAGNIRYIDWILEREDNLEP